MDDRIFDVSKPHQARPDVSGKPIIVGHHPVMSDPMVRPPYHPPTQPQSPLAQQSYPPPMSPQPPQPATPKLDNYQFTTPVDPAPQAASPTPPLPPVDGPAFADSPTPPESPQPQGPAPLSDQQFMNTDPMPIQQTNIPPPQQPHLEPAPISHNRRRGKRWLVILFVILALIIAGYLAVDAGAFGNNINLPFHIFKHNDQTDTSTVANTTPTPSPTPPPAAQATIPAGFTNYTLTGTSLNIPYPTDWGTPTSSTEMGYSKRGGTNKADGVYAYMVSFATNKDVQIVITSSKYLPPARGALYYDFLQWCVGSSDSKFYKQLMHFTTSAGVDTPSTVTCDQGPLTDAVKVNDTTIVQTNTKAADKSVLGDVYTRNLKITDYPVMRVKDATSKNGDNIKKLLDSLYLTTASQ